jgi:hypothetical protein
MEEKLVVDPWEREKNLCTEKHTCGRYQQQVKEG